MGSGGEEMSEQGEMTPDQDRIMPYANTRNELRERILALIPSNPELLEMDDPWALLHIEGFHCEDLASSMFQATWALASAKRVYLEHGSRN